MLSELTTLEFFVAASAALALPALLVLAFRALFAWRYQSALARYMNQPGAALPQTTDGRSTLEPAGPARRALSVRPVEGPARLDLAAEEGLREARHAATRARGTFAFAGGLQMALTAAAVYWLLSRAPGLALVFPPALTAYLSLVPGLALLVAFTVRGTGARVALLTAYLAGGLGVVVLGPDQILANGPNVVRSHLRIAVKNAVLPLLVVALLIARWLRPVLLAVAALVVFVLVGTLVFGMLFGREVADMSLQDIPVSAMLLHVAQLGLAVALLVWLLRRPGRKTLRALLLLVTVVVAAWAVEHWFFPKLPVGQLAIGTLSDALQIYVLWLIFRGFTRLQEQHLLPSEVLHWHFCWLFLAGLTSWSIMGYESVVNPDVFAVIRLGLVLGFAPFAVHVVALHAALWRQWRRRRDRAGRRLLLLRVFADPAKRVRLLDLLGETWRRGGRIDFIAGTDLAQRHVAASALAAFFLGRLRTVFLKSPAEVDRRVDALRDRLELDLRYPVNELHCHADAWQHAVTRLAPESDVVIMDLRGFTSGHRGCAFELGVLLRGVPLRRIVLLTDRTTDPSALARTLQDAWAAVPADSENAHVADPGLIVIPLTGRTRRDREVLESCLFSIVFGATSWTATPVSAD